VDVRYTGNLSGFDWDVEAMRQGGNVGPKEVRAWAIGSLAGYTFASMPWQPRLGFQFDAASGANDPHGNVIGTFNPLLPNGYYLTLSGYEGYANLIHLKPSVTVRPNEKLRVMAAVGARWRETTQDAVYTIPDIPVAGAITMPARRFHGEPSGQRSAAKTRVVCSRD
jgi:hypothetical protein